MKKSRYTDGQKQRASRLGRRARHLFGLYPSPATRCRMPMWSATIALVRYEWLARYLFESIRDVQVFATRWLWSYNHERPNMTLGGSTPIQKLVMAN